jgi:hypothetical protein
MFSRPVHTAEHWDAQLRRIERDGLVELALDRPEDLIEASEADPLTARRGPARSGVEDLALTLSAAKRLPNRLIVRIVLPRAEAPEVVTRAESAFRWRANDLASESWREAMAIRSMGHQQLPLGIGVGIGAAVVAYAAIYSATEADPGAARGAMVVFAAIALTVAWVVGWVVVEAAILDWRQAARRAAACELLSKATLEIATDDRGV